MPLYINTIDINIYQWGLTNKLLTSVCTNMCIASVHSCAFLWHNKLHNEPMMHKMHKVWYILDLKYQSTLKWKSIEGQVQYYFLFHSVRKCYQYYLLSNEYCCWIFLDIDHWKIYCQYCGWIFLFPKNHKLHLLIIIEIPLKYEYM